MVSRIRSYWQRVRPGRGREVDASVVQTPQGRALPTTTFRPNAYETWSFSGNDLQYNGQPLDLLVQPSRPDVPLWTTLVQGLVAYRDWLLERRVLRWRRIAARIEQWHDVLSHALHHHYDARMCGLSLCCDGDDIKLNNVNLSQLLACYQVRPTSKARKFLEGIQAKLHLLLERPRDTGFSAQLGDRVRRFYHDVTSSLARETLDTLCLPLPRRSMERG